MYSLLIASSAETSFQIKTAYLFYWFFTKCSYDFLVFVFHLIQDYIIVTEDIQLAISNGGLITNIRLIND